MSMMPNVIQFQPRMPNTRSGHPFSGASPRLRRPRLLVQAARAGLSGYSRKRDLRRLLKTEDLPLPGAVLPRLMAEEERLDLARREGEADYDVQRHILLLIAIIAETAASAPRPVQVTFPGTAIPAHP